MRPVMIQIRLRKCAVWSESSLRAFSIAEDAKFLPVDNEDSNQTDLSLRRAHISEGSFSHVLAQLFVSCHPVMFYFCNDN